VLQNFKKHIETNFSTLLETPFLLACSGGVDSVVLAHLSAQLNLDFSLAHCNFKLRENESDKDETFVKDLAENLEVECFTTQFDTEDYIVKKKVSIQMGARELRYKWFSELLEETRYKMVLTAHQADDNLETFLINLSRGTGIDGLTGIPPKTNTIARPLLPFSRKEIIAFAKENKIEWREDASNAETKYLRNKIRHDIVPHLKELHPTFLENFKRTVLYLNYTSVLAQKHIELTKERFFKKEDETIKINVTELEQLTPLKAYLYPLFFSYGFTEWQDVEGLLTAMSGKEVRSKTHRMLRDREYLILESIQSNADKVYHIEKNQNSVNTPVSLQFTTVKSIENISVNTIFVDSDTLEYPLTIRKWVEGDVLYPFGMKGKKKLSKFYKDEKIDVFSKGNQWLLCSNNKIVWVIGRRADARFSVKEKTTNIMRISLIMD